MVGHEQRASLGRHVARRLRSRPGTSTGSRSRAAAGPGRRRARERPQSSSARPGSRAGISSRRSRGSWSPRTRRASRGGGLARPAAGPMPGSGARGSSAPAPTVSVPPSSGLSPLSPLRDAVGRRWDAHGLRTAARRAVAGAAGHSTSSPGAASRRTSASAIGPRRARRRPSRSCRLPSSPSTIGSPRSAGCGQAQAAQPSVGLALVVEPRDGLLAHVAALGEADGALVEAGLLRDRGAAHVEPEARAP